MEFLFGSIGQFLLDNLAYFIIGATLLAFVIIVLVARKKKNKPSKYTPDEIDRTVDEVAREKAREKELREQSAEEETEPKVNQPAKVEESEPKVEQPTKVEECEPKVEDSEQVQSIEEALLTDDSEEELTFEAADVDEGKDEPKDATPTKRRTISYRILYDRESRTWEVRKDNAKRVIRRVRTKREALEIAQELSQKQDLNLVVHKKDGKFQKRR